MKKTEQVILYLPKIRESSWKPLSLRISYMLKISEHFTRYLPKFASAPETLLSSEYMLSEKYRAIYSVFAQISEHVWKPSSRRISYTQKISEHNAR